MALITLLKFTVASGALYLSKELGFWDTPENEEEIQQKNQSFKTRFMFFESEDSKKKPPCDCEPNWSSELKAALGGTFKTLAKIPDHWKRFGQIMHDNIVGFFKSDDK